MRVRGLLKKRHFLFFYLRTPQDALGIRNKKREADPRTKIRNLGPEGVDFLIDVFLIELRGVLIISTRQSLPEVVKWK